MNIGVKIDSGTIEILEKKTVAAKTTKVASSSSMEFGSVLMKFTNHVESNEYFRLIFNRIGTIEHIFLSSIIQIDDFRHNFLMCFF